MNHFISGFTTLNQQTQIRCDCHECTQARWKMSLQGQMEAAMQAKSNPTQPQPSPFEIPMTNGKQI